MLKRKQALLLGVLLSSALPVCRAQAAEAVFDDAVLHDIRLSVHPSDWQQLKDTFFENTYYPAEFTWRGITVEEVAIRSRGGGSRSGFKPGLRIDFNRFVKGQHFLGLTSLVLDNHWQDPSFLRERLSLLLFRRMGIPAPRTAYARLYVNGSYGGLYSIVEEVNKVFLKDRFGQNDGHLYEYKWLSEYHFEFLGEDPEAYAPMFKAQTHESQPEYERLVAMIKTINEAPDEDFAERMRQYLDLELLIRHLAVENYVGEYDGLLGDWGMNNFYLYRFEKSDRFQFIPWDKDVTFYQPEHSVLFNLTANRLTSRLFASPAWRDLYLREIEKCAAEAGGESGWLAAELERAVRLTRAAALEDPNKRQSNDEYGQWVEYTRKWVGYRNSQVLSQVFTLRQN